MSGSLREAMANAVKLGRERGDRYLRSEYILLGILDSEDPAALALVESATTVDALRAAVEASLPEAPATA